MYVRKSEYSDTLHYTVGSVSSDGYRNGRDSSLKRVNNAMAGHCHHNTRGCLTTQKGQKQTLLSYDVSTDSKEAKLYRV